MIQQSTYNEFQKALNAGLEGIQKAANIYVTTIDKDPTAKKEFAERFHDQITSATWRALEMVGRKQLHPRLLISGVPHGRYLKRLSYSDQERVLSGERFNCLLPNGDTLLVDLRTVDSQTADQMFNYDRVRDLDEQKLYMEQHLRIEKLRTKRPTAPELPYEFKNRGKTVLFTRQCELTKKEIESIWKSMK